MDAASDTHADRRLGLQQSARYALALCRPSTCRGPASNRPGAALPPPRRGRRGGGPFSCLVLGAAPRVSPRPRHRQWLMVFRRIAECAHDDRVQAGFTLIELMIVVALASIVAGVALSGVSGLRDPGTHFGSDPCDEPMPHGDCRNLSVGPAGHLDRHRQMGVRRRLDDDAVRRIHFNRPRRHHHRDDVGQPIAWRGGEHDADAHADKGRWNGVGASVTFPRRCSGSSASRAGEPRSPRSFCRDPVEIDRQSRGRYPSARTPLDE